MKFLIPVDGSTASVNAVKKSIEIARKYNSSIKLISVVNHDDLSSLSKDSRHWRMLDGTIITDYEETMKRITESTEKMLNAIVKELDFSGIPLEKEVLIGKPYEKIIETARNEKVDLIVMGNRGYSKIKRFFLGSVSHRVISDAPCPVLVIHTEADV